MKSKIKIFALLFILIISSVMFPKQALAQQADVSFQVFYDQLSPYGQWINYSNYGYVWVPNEGSDFVPYSTRGHWILTDYGWTWVSDYNWGWAPFHYGRWNYDNSYGWLWVPGNEWGPSWVTWRRANGYYGWAPMEPGVSISVSFGGTYNIHNDHWMFVRDRDFGRADINHYYVNRNDHDRIIRNSTVINKTYFDNKRHITYVAGPARADIERGTGRKINPVAIRENNKPGQTMSNGQLQIYRPQVKNNNNKALKPMPARIANLKDIKRPSERKAVNQSLTVKPQENNKKEQQQKASKSANVNNKAQPAQSQKSNPSNNTKTQTQQPQNANPANINRGQQPNTVKPQNNNNNKAQQPLPRKIEPSNNNGKVQQPNTVKPQNNNNNKAQPAQAHPRNVNPPNNNGRNQQPNNVRPQNNNRNEPSR